MLHLFKRLSIRVTKVRFRAMETRTNSTMKDLHFKQYLFWFANQHVEFRFAEIQAIASLLEITIKWTEKPSLYPFWIVELQSDDDAKRIADRSVTLKHVSELWASSTRIEELHEKVKNYISLYVLQDEKIQKASYKFNVDLYCNRQNYGQKIEKIETFAYIPLKGQVNLNNPDVEFQYIEYFGNDPNNVPKNPIELFFGRLVTKSQRKLISDLSLKKRKFIGNTSMDPELSLVMANCAKVSEGDLILDPFVGSGSLLVAAAYFGGYVFGVDIDYPMIHGLTKQTRKQTRHIPRVNESILENLKQYGLENRYIDVLVGDSSRSLWRAGYSLDAIITDPPYGIREATEKLGRRTDSDSNTKKNKSANKEVYSLHLILEDLLRFASVHLKIGGRIITWIPVFREHYEESKYIPVYDCFELINNCEQILSTKVSRRLLTFEKIKNCSLEDNLDSSNVSNNFREEFLEYRYGLAANKKNKIKTIAS